MHKHRLERVLVVTRHSAAWPDYGEGHPEIDRASQRLRTTNRADCELVRRLALVKAPKSVWNCC